MAYDRQGNWVAEDVQSPWARRGANPPTGGFMVGNNGETYGIASSKRRADGVESYSNDKMQQAISSANADAAINSAEYTLNNRRSVDRDNDLVGSARGLSGKGSQTLMGDIDPRQQDWLDKTGNPGYQSGGLEGKRVYNYYDPDRPASMNSQGNSPWADMARQLETFSKLRAMSDAQSLPSTGNTHMDLEVMQNRRAQMQDATQRRGQDVNYRSHIEGVGLQGQNQLANTELAYGMQGMNQMAHDQRLGENARDLEELKQRVQMNDPKNAALAEYYKSGAALHGAQADAARLSQKADPNLAIVQKMMSEGLLDPKNPEHAGIMAGATRALNSHFNGGFESNPQAQMIREAVQAGKMSREEAKAKLAALKGAYADGGQVESPEQVMARIQAKYGVSGNAPQPQAQAPASQPVRQQAPAPQQPTGGLMDRLRNVATGGLDRRMQGYAEGGPIAVGGRPVVGAGDGKSDSLPAVIDGEHPAALSTGEFVMPIEAVRHFGLDKLNKMVAAARKGLDTGRDSA